MPPNWMSPHALRQAKSAAFAAGKRDRKCGTCRSMQVRPGEVEIAQAARPMAYCGPGRHCFGGPVRGRCGTQGRMVESTQLCGSYKAGGPVLVQAGSLARGSANGGSAAEEPWTEAVTQAVTADGNVLVFAATGLLALGAIMLKDVKWSAQDRSGLPHVEDGEGQQYPYELVPGGERVAIYLPVGRKVEHHVTAAAVRDPRQLSMEVHNIVVDRYESLG